jgi:hypothetical protein
MTEFDLERYERLMASVLIAPDPIAALDALESDERALLEPIDRDGLRTAALLVARLRFERLMHGSRRAAAWFDSDPREFARAFKRYHASVPPLSTFPPQEARAFEAWLTSAGTPRSPA